MVAISDVFTRYDRALQVETAGIRWFLGSAQCAMIHDYLALASPTVH